MKPLPLESLKFAATLDTVPGPSGTECKRLLLRYYLAYSGVETELVRITLQDTEPYNAAERVGFWFNFVPVIRRGHQEGDPVRMFPQIDLIVYSSVKVVVERRAQDLDKFQGVGFEGLDLNKTTNHNNDFSPVRPKISLRRVHYRAQVPPLGSQFTIQLIKSDFSFYVDHVDGEPQGQITSRMSLADYLQTKESTDPTKTLLPKVTWTRVFFTEEYTEFNFVHSSYRLRVYDQHYDIIDGKLVMRDDLANDWGDGGIGLSEARSKIHAAKKLIALPKYLSYSLSFDAQPRLMGEGYQVDARTQLTIKKSAEVLLVATIFRDSLHDRKTAALLNDLPGPRLRPSSYKDYIPGVGVFDLDGKALGIGADVERSWPRAHYEFKKSEAQQLREFQFALVIGFTPVVGEAYMLYELYTALNYGEDPFGNKLTDTEKTMTAIFAILPFVGAVRHMRKLTLDGYPFLAGAFRAQYSRLARLRIGV